MSFINRIRKLLAGGGNGGPEPGPDDGHGTCGAITCMEALAKVHEYLDGELDGVTHEEVARHFEVCRKCYPHLKLEERFREVMRRVEARERAPAHLREQVLELLATETEEGG
jgi:anti-sigma factor (TIGR02949 family)